ncbi:hypothetical protein AUC43_18475 [Hymenobacter sedentarius]|uniref:Uncharacterized protein n=1 Tax=Hymenobacter sedentarius TaxID=1411621 RepID=A0A0U4C9A0_9BACT|nr:hypothetical protein [Hymenobacter sedentarius]ALW86888.1 hypothetical protein AUC43_18475 [Hymenobacter sedentarius]
MNYIQHTRAAHYQLTQQPAATPHHVSLYWALFFAWNAGFFEQGLDLDHAAAMQAAHIGNERTYRATLRDLEAWALLTYQPSHSRHQPSRCYLTDLSGAKVPEVKTATRGKSAPGKSALQGAEVPEPLGAEVPPVGSLSGAEVPEHSLYDKTRSTKTVHQNSAAAAQKKIGERFSGEGLSGAEVFDQHLPADRPGAAPKDSANQADRGALKRKGVQAETIRAAAAGPNQPRRRGPLPELPFSQSAIATPEAFAAAFEGTDYALADLRHYHQLVATWRDKKTGLPPTRKDWIATAQRFMLNDAADNRLKLAPHVHRPGADGTGQSNSGIPSTGYRSSRYD